MGEAPKTSKRIVSEGQYAVAQANRYGCGILGIILFGIAAIGAVSSVWDYWLVFSHRVPWYPWFYVSTFYWCLAFGGGWGAFLSVKRVRKIDPGIPVSRISADTLPVEESLVRASEEPVQEQQALLLRGTIDNLETPIDQLLRPTGEPEP